MKQVAIILFTVCMIVIACAGCRESQSNQIRKARVIANENLQLKKQLEEKDQQIESLKKEIEKIQTEFAQEIEKAGETSIKSMRLVLEVEKNNEALRLEVEKLKAEIETLKTE